jgi:hypothetical protein
VKKTASRGQAAENSEEYRRGRHVSVAIRWAVGKRRSRCRHRQGWTLPDGTIPYLAREVWFCLAKPLMFGVLTLHEELFIRFQNHYVAQPPDPLRSAGPVRMP